MGAKYSRLIAAAGIGLGAVALICAVTVHRQAATSGVVEPATSMVATTTTEPGYIPSRFPGVYVRSIPKPSSAQPATASLRKLPGAKLSQRPHAAGMYIRPKPHLVNSSVPGGGVKAVIDDNFMVADQMSDKSHSMRKSK